MFKLILKSAMVLLTIPLVSLAIDPRNPETYCDRFISETHRKVCTEKSKNPNLDWYAASVCARIQDDDVLLKCWDHVKGHEFLPDALEVCSQFENRSDEEILGCLRVIKDKGFQKKEVDSCKKQSNFAQALDCLKSQKSSRLPASSKKNSNFYQEYR